MGAPRGNKNAKGRHIMNGSKTRTKKSRKKYAKNTRGLVSRLSDDAMAKILRYQR